MSNDLESLRGRPVMQFYDQVDFIPQKLLDFNKSNKNETIYPSTSLDGFLNPLVKIITDGIYSEKICVCKDCNNRTTEVRAPFAKPQEFCVKYKMFHKEANKLCRKDRFDEIKKHPELFIDIIFGGTLRLRPYQKLMLSRFLSTKGELTWKQNRLR